MRTDYFGRKADEAYEAFAGPFYRSMMAHKFLLWGPIHEGFPGMGHIAHMPDGCYFTIRPSQRFKGGWDLRWWRADLSTCMFLGTWRYGHAVLHAEAAHIRYSQPEDHNAKCTA